jgi:putative endonuclease
MTTRHPPSAYTKPGPKDPFETDNIVARRKITDEQRRVGSPLPFTTARDLDQEVIDEVDISFVFPSDTSGYVVMVTSKDDDRTVMLYAPKDGPWADPDTAAAWATQHVYSRDNHWVIVACQSASGPPAPEPPAQDPRIVAATKWLTAQGLRILDVQWKCSKGTLDIVAADGRTLVGIDITNQLVDPLTPRHRARLRRLAVDWAVAKGVLFDEIRIDQVTVQQDGARGLAVTRHHQDVG